MASHSARHIVHIKDVFEGVRAAHTSSHAPQITNPSAPTAASTGTPAFYKCSPQTSCSGDAQAANTGYSKKNTSDLIPPTSCEAPDQDIQCDAKNINKSVSTCSKTEGHDSVISAENSTNSRHNPPAKDCVQVLNVCQLSHSSDIIVEDNNTLTRAGQHQLAKMAHVGTAKQLANKGNVHSSKSLSSPPSSSDQHIGTPSGHVYTKNTRQSDIAGNYKKMSGAGAEVDSTCAVNGRCNTQNHCITEKDSDYMSSIGSAYSHSEVSGTTSSASGYLSEEVASELMGAQGPAVLDTTQMKNSNPHLYAEHGDEGDDGFAEDECTLDFDDEEGGGLNGTTLVYREYYGEDFSQYLEDDPVETESSSSGLPHELSQYARPRRTSVPLQKQKGKRKSGSSSSVSLDRDSTYTSDSSRSNHIKDKLTQVFTLGRSHGKNKQRNKGTLSKIYNFTYDDSKLGNEGRSKTEASFSDTNTYSRQRRYKKKSQKYDAYSDFGTMSSSGPWWTGESNPLTETRSEIDTSSTKSRSVPNLVDSGKSKKPNTSAQGTIDEFYDTKPKNSESSSKNKNNLWRRFSRSLRRGEKVEYIVDDNLISHPLHSASSFEDIRL